jgi:hypothetical protein
MKSLIRTSLLVVAMTVALGMGSYNLIASPREVVHAGPVLQVVSEGSTNGNEIKLVRNGAGTLETATVGATIQVDLIDPKTGLPLESRTFKIEDLDLAQVKDKGQSAEDFFRGATEEIVEKLALLETRLLNPHIKSTRIILDDAGELVSVPVKVNFELAAIAASGTDTIERALTGERQSDGTILASTRVVYTLEGLAYTHLDPAYAHMQALIDSIEAGILAAYP